MRGLLCDGVFAWLSIVVVVTHAPYRTYGPPYRQCLDTVEFEFYSGRSWIPASLLDVDRYMKKNLWFVHKYCFLWCSRIPCTYMDVQNTTFALLVMVNISLILKKYIWRRASFKKSVTLHTVTSLTVNSITDIFL